MKKKYLTLALLFAFAFTLSACNTAKKDNTNNNNSEINNNQEPADNSQGSTVEETKYTVKFNTNGGNVINDILVVENNKIINISNPTKESDANYNYSFAGWYKDQAFSVPFNIATDIVTSNLTLYAKWDETAKPVVIEKYIVSFNSNGGTTINAIEVNSGSKIIRPADPTKTASSTSEFTFDGWYKDQALNTAFDFDNDVITSSITLYAKWKETAIMYEVSFYNGDELLNTAKYWSGNTISYEAPVISGFTFDGWYTDKGLSKPFDLTTPITKATTLYAKYIDNSSANAILKIDSYRGYNEGLFLNLNIIPDLSSDDYKISYKSKDMASYVEIDNELIRIGNKVRADIIGLKAGLYDIKVEAANQIVQLSDINVTEDDRSGYAHFKNTTGVGAYNNDGTLKNNAVVVYVNEENKNTVTAKIGSSSYTGLANIITHATDDNYPVDIRILGTIGAATWNSLTVNKYYDSSTKKGINPETAVKGANGEYLQKQNYDESDIISGGYNTLNTSEYSKLNGLTNKIKYDSSKLEFDSYYNMLDVKGAKNVTVEGIGEDAEIFQWGFTWKSDCTSIEIKNLTFNDYTEDACSFEGTQNATTISGFKGKNYWVHNNTFNMGVNYWDVCSEQDKHDGDGSTDLKCCAFVTLSYNHYYNCHKTGLVGGSDDQMSAAITFHHNFYDRCQSRLPFARQANMHMYNNYYYGSTGNNMQIYAGAYAFIENCYFENVKNTFILDARGKGTPAVKSYNNIYSNSPSTGATIVESRIQKVTNANVFGQNFDTDSSIFYFDDENSRSNVSFMLTAENVKTYVPQYAGAGTLTSFDYSLHTIENNGQYENTTQKAIYNYSSSAPTAAGLYYTVLNDAEIQAPIAEDELTPDTSVTIDDEKIYINDTSSVATTIGYYMFDNESIYTSGTHTYSTSIYLSGVGSKWDFIRFLDNNGNECLTIGAMSTSKYMCYTYNSEQILIKETAFAANKTYTISLTVNYDNNTANITVDGTTVQITSFDVSAISGIKFFTAKTAIDRSLIVNNIEIN